MRMLIKSMSKAIWMPKIYRFNVCLSMKDWRLIKRKKFISLIAETNRKKKKLISVQISILNKIFKIQAVKMDFSKTKIKEGWHSWKMKLIQKIQALTVKKKKIRHSTLLM